MAGANRLQAAWRAFTRPELVRTEKASGKRDFAAARINRLTGDWATSLLSADQDVFRALKPLRARSRELSNNNPYIKRYLNMCRVNIVGPQGIKLQNRATDERGVLDNLANKAIESAWDEWGKMGTCDVTGKLSWLAFQRLFIECVAKDGEVLVRKVKNFPNKFGFALQLLEADFLDESLNVDLGNGNFIRMGVEFNEWRRPVAYHIFQQQPNDIYYQAPTAGKHIRIPADEIIHAFDPQRPNQSRGIPWAHASMTKLNMLNGYEEAELVAARLGANKGGFFERNEDGEGVEADGYTADEDEEEEGEIITDSEPGVYTQLPKGVTFRPYDPQHPGVNFASFVKSMLRSIAGGLGVAYNGLANDLEGVNFSSIRAGVLEERDAWIAHQEWMIENLPEQVFPEWLEMAMLKGAVKLPFTKFDKFNSARWQGRRWAWVDPLKDIKAKREEVTMLGMSVEEFIREKGEDPDEVFAEIVKTREKMKKLGLDDLFNLIYQPNPAPPASETTANDA